MDIYTYLSIFYFTLCQFGFPLLNVLVVLVLFVTGHYVIYQLLSAYVSTEVDSNTLKHLTWFGRLSVKAATNLKLTTDVKILYEG